MKYLAVMSVILLTACEAGSFDTAESTSLVLPIVKKYSDETQSKAAQEMTDMQCPTLNDFMIDYRLMRNETRIALGALSN
jgi:hypothetical protein